ncbi:MAG: hypothetical protein NTV57_14425 [Cyanobacteria bacterium]|nr:hypothetical protein [Cyanobacteriota bacterium]
MANLRWEVIRTFLSMDSQALPLDFVCFVWIAPMADLMFSA